MKSAGVPEADARDKLRWRQGCAVVVTLKVTPNGSSRKKKRDIEMNE